MKKISILSLHLGYGGIEKSVVALANLLSSKYDVEIACTYKLYDNSAFDLNSKVKINYLTDCVPNREEFCSALKKAQIFKAIKEGVKSLKILYKRRSTMINYIKNTKCDVMIATRDIFDNWLSKYGSDEVLKIGWEHNHPHGNMDYARKIVNGCKNLDYLVLVSNELKEFYQSKLDNCKCVYIPNILDHIPDNCSKLNNKRFISVGRLSKEKGYLDLLEIYNKISRKYSDWKLDIIGDGKEKENLELFIKKNKLETKVILHGFQDKKYIDNLLDKSSIYLMSSFTESFGIVLIEAMSHGLPCVAFDSAEGAREIIIDNETGFLIKDRDKNEYISKVEKLIEDYSLRKKCGQNGYKSIQKYSGNEVIKSWYEIIEKK
jgi:N-acetylglucosaminyldiphosphoundecaprenol N-acetyl-beta-D-mannosaminyltransferase